MLVSRTQLGVAIAEARAKVGLTQAELAQRAGLAESIVSALEQGQYKPTAKVFLQPIAAGFSCWGTL